MEFWSDEDRKHGDGRARLRIQCLRNGKYYVLEWRSKIYEKREMDR